MKLHYTKILLFSLPLNILENNKNKAYITEHTPITTSRVLSECDTNKSIYNNDPDMKSVKENFDRQTSQRFEEYNKRMIKNRKKCKEQCDKDIQKIVVKDKMEKSLAEKVEKVCLMCGCGLGGGVAPVWGLGSGLVYAGWSNYVTQTAIQKGIEAGVASGIENLKGFNVLHKLISISRIESLIHPKNYANRMTYVTFTQEIKTSMCEGGLNSASAFCSATKQQSVQVFAGEASKIADTAVAMGKIAEKEVLDAAAPALTTYSNAIIASTMAILVVALIMLIIYLILRYRRKNKMNKKQQYTQLLNK
ncbi:PIR protein, putative [Plasmodium sp.]|nr:PIR protein, putative [Plasmodium sp.]